MKYSHDVAKYIIAEFHEAEDFITNMKVQKLLYYVQGWHLGLYGAPVFDKQFQVWFMGRYNMKCIMSIKIIVGIQFQNL